jgi:hypothetical protein
MEAQDRSYLNELSAKPEHYERFLKELTPRERLPEADQNACLGLVMTDPHHQTLAREYADKKAEIERMLGMGGASAGAGAAAVPAPRVATPPRPASPPAEDPELGRLRAEVARLQRESAEKTADVTQRTAALADAQRQLAAKTTEVTHRDTALAERAEQIAKLQADLTAAQREKTEALGRVARLQHELADKTTEVTHLAEALDGIESQLSHLRLRAEAAPISSREAQEALMRIWQGKYTPEGSVPTFMPVARKDAGASVGFIAEKEHTKPDAAGDRKRWMAKFGMPDTTAAVTESMTSRGRDQQRTVITSINLKP